MAEALLSQPVVTSSVTYQPLRLAWPSRLIACITLSDTLVIALALLLSQVLRFGVSSINTADPQFASSYALLGVFIGLMWLVALSAARSRQVRLVGVGLVEYQRVVNATLWTFGIFAIIAFLADASIARGYLAVALPVGLAGLLATRLFWRRRLIAMRRAGRCMTGTIIAGPLVDVRRAVKELSSNVKAGYRSIAVTVTDADDLTDPLLAGLERVPYDDLVAVARQTRTRAVMIAGSLPGGREAIRTLGWDLEDCSAELILVSRLTDVAGPRMSLRPVEGLPMVHVDLPQYTGVSHGAKRALDFTLSLIAVIALSPVLVALAIAVRTTSPGPVFFLQERVGQRGNRFRMVKFRSMVVDAEARLEALRAQSEGNGVLFKMRDDPRVTPLGAVMRRYSLDELPQLFNVLSGEMSLVGPRPPLPSEVEQYEGRVDRRLLTKPGITGPWQVGGRSALSWEDSVRLDLSYVENWSITGDLLILLKTIRAVIKKDGAY